MRSTGNPVTGPNRNCTAITASDSLWRTVDCSTRLPVVCQSDLATLLLVDSSSVSFANAASLCPPGYTVGVPTTAMDNRAVAASLQLHNVRSFASLWSGANSSLHFHCPCSKSVSF